MTASEFLRQGDTFRAELQALKRRLLVPDYGWYPYETLSALGILTELIEPVFDEVAPALSSVQSPTLAAPTATWAYSVPALAHRSTP